MKDCCVCNKGDPNYKCPTCRQPYCSLGCYKKHKENVCEPPAPLDRLAEETGRQGKEYRYPTEDTVPLDKLNRLKESEEVKECLKNPHVRDIINAILRDEDPTKAIGLAMTEPIFVELADACLRVVEPQDDERPS